MPFLDPSKSIDEYYESSPFLFWSIIEVASRRYRDQPGLLTALNKPVTDLLWQTVATAPLKLPHVQGLLLAATWPCPTLRMKSDISGTLCNIAMASALQFGYHRPNYAFEWMISRIPMPAIDSGERLRTWATINIIGQM